MTKDRTWIYLLRDPATGFYKIGQSLDPIGRLKTLCKQDTLQPTANEYEIIEAWWSVPQDERLLHRAFTDDRQRGEWFDLDANKLKEVWQYFTDRQPYSGLNSRPDIASVMADMWNENRRLNRKYETDIDSLKQQLLGVHEEWAKCRESIKPHDNPGSSASPVNRLMALPKLSDRKNG